MPSYTFPKMTTDEYLDFLLEKHPVGPASDVVSYALAALCRMVEHGTAGADVDDFLKKHIEQAPTSFQGDRLGWLLSVLAVIYKAISTGADVKSVGGIAPDVIGDIPIATLAQAISNEITVISGGVY